mmetsp:Transcript_35043/g.52952  ORF Transcript_35043/g.52952 Transcript_35043/m.52952 type:complete len:82 (+) Transcript_35043:875-1120(+)
MIQVVPESQNATFLASCTPLIHKLQLKNGVFQKEETTLRKSLRRDKGERCVHHVVLQVCLDDKRRAVENQNRYDQFTVDPF